MSAPRLAAGSPALLTPPGLRGSARSKAPASGGRIAKPGGRG